MTAAAVNDGFLIIYYRPAPDRSGMFEMRLAYDLAYLGSFLGADAYREWDSVRRVTVVDRVGLDRIQQRATPLGITLVDATGKTSPANAWRPGTRPVGEFDISGCPDGQDHNTTDGSGLECHRCGVLVVPAGTGANHG